MSLSRARVALITGASRGIGRAIALACAGSGYDVAISYVRQADAGEQTLKDVLALGVRAITVQADLAMVEDIGRLVGEVEARLGEIDVLVNNAGAGSPMPLSEIGLAEWTESIATNLTSAFLISQRVVPGMRRRGWGRLIFLSSIAAQTGGVIGPHYAASKAGMLGLMHSYANLLAGEGITSNAVAPALIETDMIRGNDRIRPALIPVGRFGTADETAQAVMFLVQNGYMTGQTINVNGGWYMS